MSVELKCMDLMPKVDDKDPTFMTLFNNFIKEHIKRV